MMWTRDKIYINDDILIIVNTICIEVKFRWIMPFCNYLYLFILTLNLFHRKACIFSWNDWQTHFLCILQTSSVGNTGHRGLILDWILQNQLNFKTCKLLKIIIMDCNTFFKNKMISCFLIRKIILNMIIIVNTNHNLIILHYVS